MEKAIPKEWLTPVALQTVIEQDHPDFDHDAYRLATLTNHMANNSHRENSATGKRL